MNGAALDDLCARLREGRGMLHKTDIAATCAGLETASSPCKLGDDCAAIPDGDGYALLAIEGLLDEFVRCEPWFAGYCGVMVNLSDVAAMGGRPTAVVDALWACGTERAEAILAGMRAASSAYGVPIVGGHTNLRSDAERLAVAVLGRANRLLTSFDARPGDVVLASLDLRGAYMDPYPYWNCSTSAPPARLRLDLALPAEIAEAGLACAGKDVSMAGLLGTLLMLLEGSGVGASIDLARVPRPPGVSLEKWLESFPSYGFLLAAPPANVAAIRERFTARDIACEAIGACDAGGRLDVVLNGERATFWDLRERGFTRDAALA